MDESSRSRDMAAEECDGAADREPSPRPRGARLAIGAERSSRQLPSRLVAEVFVDEDVSAEP